MVKNFQSGKVNNFYLNLKLFMSSQMELKVALGNLPAPAPGVAPAPGNLLAPAPAKRAGSGGSGSGSGSETLLFGT